jgi:acetyl-CoA carboxylase carboxyltransferase component
MDNVAGYGEMFRQNVLSSGVIPQISAIMGVCTGGAVYSPALTDFILQVENTAQMFITGPGVIKAVTGESVSFEELGGVRVHTEKSGVATLAAKDDKDCLDKIRKLLSFLPSNNKECPPLLSPRDDPHRETPLLAQIVPADPSEFFDIHEVISEIVDEGDFFELFPDFALNIVIGFARMAGRTVAVIANQCLYYAGVLDINAADKASRFIRFSDAFGIPIVSLVDVPGYLPGVHQEHQGIIRHGAKMLYAYAEATVPKITCILRKAYGGSIPAMGGCHEIGVDYIMAWPCAEMAMMAAEPAVEIIYRKEIQNAPDPAEYKKAKVKEYRETFCTPYFAASKQLIDAVIEPKDTRKKIIRALLMLENKTEETPCRKHGIFPV